MGLRQQRVPDCPRRDTRDYTYAPYEEIAIAPLMFTEAAGVITREMVQGRQYAIGGIVSDDWFVDNDFFERGRDDTYTFLTSDNNKGWWTDPDWDQAMAPIAAKKYRITLTVGQQLAATDINFKFFGQPTWGIEFNGQGGQYHLDSDNEWFRVNAADSDNGNVFLKDGVTLNDGDTYVFTIDLTRGIGNGKILLPLSQMINVRKIIHVDMDQFFAAVEQRDNPPAIQGGEQTDTRYISQLY